MINLHKSTEPFEFDDSNWFGYEKPSVLEAFRVLSKEGYYVAISGHDYDMRKKRLKKEYEKNTKAPGPGEEQSKEGNPALKEAATQFNDALLDEQAKKIKRLGKKIARLNGIIHDKNAILSDVAEELRLSKIREKNLTEVCQKKVKVIDVLGKELEATKNELEEKNYLIDMLRCGSREYCEYGIAAEKMSRKMAKVIVKEGPVSSEDFKEYRRLANGYRFNPQLPDFSVEEEKKLTAKILDFNAKCMKAARESINDVFESYAAKYAKSSLDDLKEKAYESFNAKAYNLGLVGSKDGNGIIDQMVGADFAEEGGDQSATIVQCGNGITLSKEETEIVERCTKNGIELHYSEKDGLTYTNVFGKEMPISCLRGMFHVFTDEEIRNLKK